MARTTFSGPVVSDNGFVGSFTGGTTNLTLSGNLSVAGSSTLTGAVTATAGVNGPVGEVTRSTGKFTTVSATGNATLSGTANVIIIPTVDPAVAGAIWNDAGTLKVSAGA
jgi:hypothetical protein